MREWEKNLKPEEYGLTQEEYDRLSDGSTLAAEKSVRINGRKRLD